MVLIADLISFETTQTRISNDYISAINSPTSQIPEPENTVLN